MSSNDDIVNCVARLQVLVDQFNAMDKIHDQKIYDQINALDEVSGLDLQFRAVNKNLELVLQQELPRLVSIIAMLYEGDRRLKDLGDRMTKIEGRQSNTREEKDQDDADFAAWRMEFADVKTKLAKPNEELAQVDIVRMNQLLAEKLELVRQVEVLCAAVSQ
ncbi:hypothetical protein K504DRAFT_188639 [Pleomassaria siparia CBS 279.74]|uniref:Uncharacterized protein n=1 Tax=Pleomassaria siparia CBS 279.74 TaxID=1314801 RepID=A0A6G1JQP7_9PLEO|nr:hypothetical protein K504DRAFT_188639 [Pleomassaria siparia CBS 279.74]